MTWTGHLELRDAVESLFGTLWGELDFDDHPLNGNHSPIPQGRMEFCFEQKVILLSDERVRFEVHITPSSIDIDWMARTGAELDPRPLSIHLLSSISRLMRPPPHRLGLHRWTLPITLVPPLLLRKQGLNWESVWDEEVDSIYPVADCPSTPKKLAASLRETRTIYSESNGMKAFDWNDIMEGYYPLGKGGEKTTDFSSPSMVLGWRNLLTQMKSVLVSHDDGLLNEWTWHLEIDNKNDRSGWYIRCPETWNSLFTIFVGLGWMPSEPASARGLFLFERAPIGELDRADEEEANISDATRVDILCSEAGPFSRFVSEGLKPPLDVRMAASWTSSSTPIPLSQYVGDVVAWPPHLGRWPLLMARGQKGQSVTKLFEWFIMLLTELTPSIHSLHGN